MSEEKLKRIEEKLSEVVSMVHILCCALNNPSNMTDETVHHGRFARLIERKLNKMYNEFM